LIRKVTSFAGIINRSVHIGKPKSPTPTNANF
jgi:hypothetical protein